MIQGVVLFVNLPAIITPNTTYTTIPNVTSIHPIFQAQSNPLVILLDEFTNENYSSFLIALNITEPGSPDVSSKIWIAPMLNLTNTSYTNKDIILPDTTYSIRFHALTGSTFNVTFPSLSGSSDAYVAVELRKLVESGLNNSVLLSQSVRPSTDSQSVTFTLQMPEFVELRIVNERVSGTFDYNITVKEISLEGAKYVCTVNSTSTCQSTGVYDNNYILAQTASESASVYPIIVVTLVGEEKPVPTEIMTTDNMHEPVAVIIGLSVVHLVVFIVGYILLLILGGYFGCSYS